MSKTDPDHYRQSDIESIDVIEDWGLGYHLGNVIKYIARHKHKGDEGGDLAKALWYLQRHQGFSSHDLEIQLSQAHWEIESLRMELNRALAREQLREEGIDVDNLSWGDDSEELGPQGEWVGDKEYWEAPDSWQPWLDPTD